jgi:N-acetyl-gamma-glutamyl-phosphate reductase
MPHVASFFRGISLTISFKLDTEFTTEDLRALFSKAYGDEPRVDVCGEIPQVRSVQNTPDAHVGGFTVDARDPTRGVLVVVLDNLLKGAASQAMQNLNLALGLDESAGLDAV